MARTVFAMITLLDDGSIGLDPGFGNRPGQGGSGNRPGQPIYHPGHPDHGHVPHPDQGLPGGSGGQPDQGLPPYAPGSPDQGLPVPPGIQPPPAPGGALKDKLVVLWHTPGQTQWHGKVIDPSASAGTPLPEAPEPKA